MHSFLSIIFFLSSLIIATHSKIPLNVNPWLIRVNVWQKPLQYCKVISLQLIKINEKKILSKNRKKNKIKSSKHNDEFNKVA